MTIFVHMIFVILQKINTRVMVERGGKSVVAISIIDKAKYTRYDDSAKSDNAKPGAKHPYTTP